ncbi:MAG: hypothetical protein ACOC1H_05015, partial [Desulfosalsimonas sp.]
KFLESSKSRLARFLRIQSTYPYVKFLEIAHNADIELYGAINQAAAADPITGFAHGTSGLSLHENSP